MGAACSLLDLYAVYGIRTVRDASGGTPRARTNCVRAPSLGPTQGCTPVLSARGWPPLTRAGVELVGPCCRVLGWSCTGTEGLARPCAACWDRRWWRSSCSSRRCSDYARARGEQTSALHRGEDVMYGVFAVRVVEDGTSTGRTPPGHTDYSWQAPTGIARIPPGHTAFSWTTSRATTHSDARPDAPRPAA